MNLNYRNTITNDALADATKVQENFDDVKNFVDPIAESIDGIIKQDGSTPFSKIQSYKTLTIIDATNATPIVIRTETINSFETGDKVYINGVIGNTAANGIFTITRIDNYKFSLDVSVGNGTYTTGGTVYLYPKSNEHLANVAYVASVNSIPIGSVFYFAKNTAPSGFLECNGSAISRTTYANLFTIIGTTFGIGDGSTTFNLPNLRGCFIRGWDNGRGLDTTQLTGNIVSGSNVVTNLTTTEFMYVGMAITGTGIPTNSTIATIAGSTSITISNNATATTTGVSLTFTGRKFGSYQFDDFKAHNHTGGTYSAANTGSNEYSSALQLTVTGTTGGSETRPKNIALLPCIKY